MPARIANRLKFLIERLVLRGAHYRLMVIAAAIGLVAVLAGLLVYASSAAFTSPAEAVWWAFLRMTDPGYLGEDEGILLRLISTLLTVLGFVLFVGALIAILTQWMNQSIRKLESGFTPVALRHHVVILGWTNRTASIVRELVLAEGRLQRFLRRHGARGLRIAILAEEIGAELRQELRDRLGRLWNERQTVLRTGTPLRLEHLRRVDFGNAAAVIIPASDFRQGGGVNTDARIIKTLLSMGTHRHAAGGADGELPLVVAEIFDARKLPAARAAYAGRTELLASDSIISRLIAQDVRQPGLSSVYAELLTNGRGNQVYVREHPEFIGSLFHSLSPCFPAATLLGVARPEGSTFSPILNPPPDFRLDLGDRLAMLARRYSDTEAGPGNPLHAPAAAVYGGADRPPRAPRRVLIMGWSRRVPALIREFDSYAGERFRIDILSALPIAERQSVIDRYQEPPENVELTQIVGDYLNPAELRRVDPAGYDNVVIMGSDRLESGEESDARSMVGSLMVRERLAGKTDTSVLVELLDPENLPLFRRQGDAVIVTPLIMSHMLAQVALRPELRTLFDELFGPGGAEITFVPVAAYGFPAGDINFAAVERAASARGEISLGYRRVAERADRDGGVHLNPSRARPIRLEEHDELIVLLTPD